MAVACVEEGNGRNTGSLSGGAAHANRQPVRVRSGRQGGGEVRRYRRSRVTPAEGRDLRWKRWRKGAGSREWPTAYHPGDERESRTAVTCTSEGDDQSGRRRQGVNRPAEAPADWRKGANRGATARETQPPVANGDPCASRMIPLESPVLEIGTPGSESGGRKRTHGRRPAARGESAGSATDALPATRLSSTLLSDPGGRPRRLRRSVPAEPSRQLHLDGVEVDVADLLEQLGGPAVVPPTGSARASEGRAVRGGAGVAARYGTSWRTSTRVGLRRRAGWLYWAPARRPASSSRFRRVFCLSSRSIRRCSRSRSRSLFRARASHRRLPRLTPAPRRLPRVCTLYRVVKNHRRHSSQIGCDTAIHSARISAFVRSNPR